MSRYHTPIAFIHYLNNVFHYFSDPNEFTEETDIGGEATVVTVEGGRADLPCDIEAKSQDDSVYLVLWYRKNSGTPIYRFVISFSMLQACGPFNVWYNVWSILTSCTTFDSQTFTATSNGHFLQYILIFILRPIEQFF